MIAAILNSAILDSAILVFALNLIHTCQDWFPPFAQKKLHSFISSHHLQNKTFTNSFWLNLMMAAILNSAMLDSYTAILDSDTLLSSLRFTQKHSHSTLTLTQTNSISSTWWWQPSWILPSWIQPFCTKLWLKLIQSGPNSFILTQLDDGSHLEFCHLGFSHFAQKKLHSFILTQLDDGSHLEFCHLGFRHLVFFSQIHSKTLSLHSDSESNLFNLTQTHSFSLN